jgi:hypothetical protein
MQQVSMDIFYLNGTEYLVTVDRYSKWPHCTPLKSSRSAEVIQALEDQFSVTSHPEQIVSDNAAQFCSYEFRCCLEDRNISHITTSPYLSRSNGLAERMNQTIKNSLAKSLESGQSLTEVLSTIRTTPLGSGLPSPAVILQGRELRVGGSGLHCTVNQLKPKFIDHKKIIETFRAKQDQSSFDNSTSCESRKFHVGMEVWVKMGHRKWVRGRITEHASTPNSFMVQFEDGRILRRSQAHMRPARSYAVPKPAVQPAPRSAVATTGAAAALACPGVATDRAVSQNYVTKSGRVSKPPDRLCYS